MRIKEVMNKKISTIKADDSIEKAIKILVSSPQSALPVLDNQSRCVGEIDKKDLLLLYLGKEKMHEEEGLGFGQVKYLLATKAKKVKDLMNKHELTLSPDDEVLEAAKLLYNEEFSTIPITDKKGKLVGILTDICILKHYKQLIQADKK